MTREDALRELELLPIWTLRAPLPAQVSTEVAEALPTNPAINTPVASGVIMVSDDKKWAFVLPDELSGQSADLFKNMLRVLKTKPTQAIQSQQLMADIEQLGAGVVITMGEIASQKLLSSPQSLADLRGKIHELNGARIIATYHPDDLLQHLPNKAKAWDDLCMALTYLSA